MKNSSHFENRCIDYFSLFGYPEYMKGMQELSKKQRKYLFKQAHSLDPVIRIGKQGVTEQVIKAVDQALLDHELIKVKFGEFKDDKHELAEKIAESTGAGLIRIIGHVAVYYRPHPDPEERRYTLPQT